MNEQIEFDMLLDSVLHEAANLQLQAGMDQRLASKFALMQRADSQSPTIAWPVQSSRDTRPRQATTTIASLWTVLRNLFSAANQPPLTLRASTIPASDHMTDDRAYSSTAYALAIHAMAILVVGFVVRAQVREIEPVHTVTPLITPVLRVVARASTQMGGGGGQRGETPVSQGHLPKLQQQQIVPPKATLLLPPKIAVEPSIVLQKDVKLADNTLPNLGLPSSPLAGISMGNGKGMGLGPGSGDGIGPGSGGNTGDGLRHVGGSVTAPEVLYGVEPEFTEEARKAKASGDVAVYLWVDKLGNPTHIRVMRGLGMGLDERAVEAVKQYKFKPAMENGKPVTVEMYVIVNFQIL